MEIKISILDYLGKLEKCVFVLISLVYKDKYYEGIFIYDDVDCHLTVDSNLENELGVKIKNYSEYEKLINELKKSVVPWEEIINMTDDLDLSIFNNDITKTVYIAKEVDSNMISPTNSNINKN